MKFPTPCTGAAAWQKTIATTAWRARIIRSFPTRYRNYYYGVLARRRLATLPAAPTGRCGVVTACFIRRAARSGLADHRSARRRSALQPRQAAGECRHDRSRGARVAGRQHHRSVLGDAGDRASIYTSGGEYYRALQALKRAISGYFAMDVNALPSPYWQGLFPRPYWDALRSYSEENGLDPYLVASLIRQESEFNPSAISHANAYGLMQLLPETGKGEAKKTGLVALQHRLAAGSDDQHRAGHTLFPADGRRVRRPG